MSVKQKSHDQKANKMSEIDEQVLKLFDVKKKVGKGAYGIVWQATDRKTQQTVALKKIFDAFRNEIDAQRTFREVMFLKAFKNHPNIIELYSIHRANNHMDLYLSFEYMESDLHNIIKRGSLLKDVHKRFIMYQLFNATQYIHSGNVIHRDMKPSNVLLDSKCRCKIADFGLARSIAHQAKRDSTAGQREPLEPCLTDYVATRWYRAPEILVASKKYTMGIDLWSLGCILGEMIRGKPLFPGSCTVNQMERIISALPEATDDDIASVGAGFGSVLLSNQTQSVHLNLDDLLVGSPPDASELVKSLLVMNPNQRLTAKEALGHKYIEKFRNTCKEAELTIDIVPPYRDDVKLSVSDYRSKLYEMMASNEKLNANERRELDAAVTVTQCPRPHSKKTIITKLSDQTKHDIEDKTSSGQYINDTKLLNRKGQLKKSQTSTQNLCSRTPAMANKKLTKNMSISNDTLCQNKINTELNSSSQCTIKNSCKLYRHASEFETEYRNADEINEKNNSNKVNTAISPTRLDRRNSVDNNNIRTVFVRTKPTIGADGNLAKDRRPSFDNDSKQIMNRFYDRNNNKTMPSINKYKMIKTLQNNQIKENVPGSKMASTKDLLAKQPNQVYSGCDLISNRKNCQTMSDDYYDTKLKLIDDRIRKHKMQMKSSANLNEKTKISNYYTEQNRKKQQLATQMSTIGQGQQFVRPKGGQVKSHSFLSDTVPLKMYSEGYTDNDYNNMRYRVNNSHSNYAVISASDLVKLRAP